MGGTNPYIEKADYELPRTAYTVTFITPDGVVTKVEVDPAKIPYGPTGLPGSLLDVAMGNGVALEHVCGGVCACSTCHVYVKQGLDDLTEAKDREEDILDKAFDVKANSRLGCQSRIESEDAVIVVEISHESRQAFLDEHPEIRAALKAAAGGGG